MPTTRDERASAIMVALPFRGMFALWGGVSDASDRAQAAYLYRGVFNAEQWQPATPEDEEWTAVTAQSETWTERTKQTESWTNFPGT